MARKQSDDKEILVALAFVKEIKRQAPPGNQMVATHLDEWERTLHEALFNLAYQRSKKN